MQATIAFIGAGNMASAIIGGLIHNGLAASHIRAADPYQPSLDKLAESYGIHTSQDNNQIISGADIVVLAVKPQQMHAVCANIQASLQQHQPLIISIAAGITCGMLEQWIASNAAIVRCMPNTPALVQTGATGLFANARVSDEQKQQADQLLQAIGIVNWVASETQLDAVTALSGSGPAYFFLVMEAMQAAGEALGLDAETAKSLTLQTALGAAKMATESDVDAAELRRRVTSPGGTTAAALAVFENAGLRQLFQQALTAADERSKTLATEMLGESS